MLAQDTFNWWIGVVEDRNDPEKLGRVRVRIFGAHTDNKDVLPTSSLPWAIPMQPTTSAAISGLGTAPVGLVNGTWCIGFFVDGKDMQQPVIMGTIGGMPDLATKNTQENTQQQQNPPNAVRATDGTTVYDSFGNPIISEGLTTSQSTNAIPEIKNDLPPLSKDKIQSLMNAIALKESSSQGATQNYSATNQLNYIGKYQFGAAALATLGYIKIPQGADPKNSLLDDPANWTGKDGLKSKEDFFKSAAVQESIMFQNLQFNHKVLTRNGAVSTNDPPEKVGGLLATAHLLGAGGASQLAKGIDGKDANGTTGRSYYNVGAAAIGAVIPPPDQLAPNIPAGADPFGALNDPALAQMPAFADPEGIYPKASYENYPDTNKLAVGNTTSGTPIETRTTNLRKKVSTVLMGTKWDEPNPAYCAEYPYNQTFETEAGHLVEFDNTPGQERIHLFHKSGSYIELDVNGSMIRKIMGDDFEIVENNSYVFTRGAKTITVEGATQVLIKNDVDMQVFGDVRAEVNKNMDFRVAGNINMKAGNYFNIDTKYMNIYARDFNSFTTNKTRGKSLMGFDYESVGGWNLSTVESTNIASALGFNVLAATVAADATTISFNSGEAAAAVGTSKATSLQDIANYIPPILGTAPGFKKNIESTNVNPMTRPDCTPEAFLFDACEPEGIELQKQIEANTDYVPTEPVESDASTIEEYAPPADQTALPIPEQPTTEPKMANCSEFNSFNTFPASIKLSKYFTLGDVSSRTALTKAEVVAQKGLTQQQIVCNLKNLCTNVLDNIKAQYPDMIITSAFRVGENELDHGSGMAADLQFTKASQSQYYDIIQWIAQNVPYKQLLLEYGGGARNPWIHVAFDVSGQKAAMPYGTMKDHRTYAANKFINLG